MDTEGQQHIWYNGELQVSFSKILRNVTGCIQGLLLDFLYTNSQKFGLAFSFVVVIFATFYIIDTN